ncbi:MAG: hypothetical protein GC160_17240 [Acidobacteria bacterium]|nr:hypothetical protein [Acidobacteriota bacterium]
MQLQQAGVEALLGRAVGKQDDGGLDAGPAAGTGLQTLQDLLADRLLVVPPSLHGAFLGRLAVLAFQLANPHAVGPQDGQVAPVTARDLAAAVGDLDGLLLVKDIPLGLGEELDLGLQGARQGLARAGLGG